MGRKPGPDLEKIRKIKSVFKDNPEGLWVREIARKTGLDKSTVSIYLSNYMSSDVEEIFLVKGSLIKIMRLKK